MIKLNGKEVEFIKFPNGELKLEHTSLSLNPSRAIEFKYENDSDFIKLLFLKRYLDQCDQFGFNRLTVYYMPYSRMDRSEENSPFTLKYISEFINSLNFHETIIIEPHSNVTPALINNSKSLMLNETLVSRVEILGNYDFTKDCIMFPDAGAASRYKNINFPHVIIGNKKRDFVTGKIKSLDLIGEMNLNQSKRVLIIDDLSSYGGTFIQATKALKEKGFETIELLVAHAEDSIFKGELFQHISHLYTTDSILTEQDNWENAKFKKQLTVFKIEDFL